MAQSLNPNAILVPPPCDIPPFIYAEYLPALQIISIQVDLPTASEWKTKVIIGKDAQTLHVLHEGLTTQLLLPVPAALRDEHLALGPKNRNQINPGHMILRWRIKPATAVLEAAAATTRNTGPGARVVPWSAADLVPGVDVVCRKCQAVVVDGEKLREWKDLPSENWAEMMEFWHCHKPVDNKKEDIPVQGNGVGNGNGHDHGDEKASDDKLAERGYGANSTISAQSGVGFVDLTKFLFHGEDCRGLQITVLPSEKDEKKSAIRGGALVAAKCVQCSAQIGHFEFRKTGFTFYKWTVTFANRGPSDHMHPRTAPPNLAQCISAALLEIQARDNAAKVVLQGDHAEAVTVWVLNPHVVFSCRATQRARAIKVLWREGALGEAAGELEVPDEVVREVRASLVRSGEFLPVGERTAMGGVWNVGLLQRL